MSPASTDINVETATSLPVMTIFSPRGTVKLRSLNNTTPSTVLLISLTDSTSFPRMRSVLKMMYGYLREEGLMSSSVILSSNDLRELACFDFDALALKRWINVFSSFI